MNDKINKPDLVGSCGTTQCTEHFPSHTHVNTLDTRMAFTGTPWTHKTLAAVSPRTVVLLPGRSDHMTTLRQPLQKLHQPPGTPPPVRVLAGECQHGGATDRPRSGQGMMGCWGPSSLLSPPELPAQPSLCGGLIWFQPVCLPFRFSSKKRPMNPRLSLSSCPPLRSDTYIELIHTPSCAQVTSNCKDREPMQTSSGLHLQAQGLTSQPFPTNFPSSSASRRYSGAHGIFTFQIPSQNTEWKVHILSSLA